MAGKTNQYKDRLLLQKLFYTLGILFLYLIGRSIPLFGIDTAFYKNQGVNAETLLIQTISGDLHQCSLFALGISPYMTASILVQVVTMLRKSESRAKQSRIRQNRVTTALMLGIALVQSVLHVRKLVYCVPENELLQTQIVSIAAMMAGVVLIQRMSERNKKYGIGGQTVLILVNITDGLLTMVTGCAKEKLPVLLGTGFLIMLVTVFAENTEKRIGLQRIGIQSNLADKNYMAIKLNPIGIMPAMFATAFFLLPQIVVNLLHTVFPTNPAILWILENLMLTKPLGIGVFLFFIYLLSVVFSLLFLSPEDVSDRMLKNGDSFVNLHPGKVTKRYLTKSIVTLGIISATIMGACVGVPLVLQYLHPEENTAIMVPTSVMMLTGLVCTLWDETHAIRKLDTAEPFIGIGTK